MRYGPLAAKAAGCCGICLFLPPSCAVPILADKAMSRVRWRTERSEACPGRGPAGITLRLLRRKKKGRSNRQPRAAARGRPPPCAPLPWLAVRGEHAPATGARPHTARPVKDHLSNHGAQRPARGVGARCLHAARQPTPVPHPGPATMVHQHRSLPDTPACPQERSDRPWPFCWCAPRGQALTQEPGGSTFHTLTSREDRPQRTRDRSGTAAEPAGASALRRAPWRGVLGGGRHQRHGQSAAAPVPAFGASRGAGWSGKAPRPFKRVAAPMGGQNVAWQP
jgi:hypothetical protein